MAETDPHARNFAELLQEELESCLGAFVTFDFSCVTTSPDGQASSFTVETPESWFVGLYRVTVTREPEGGE